MLFARLPPVPRRKILAYIDQPSFEGWKNIRDLVVAPGLSLMDVLDSVDRCWPGVCPSAILVARCSAVVEKRHDELAALEI